MWKKCRHAIFVEVKLFMLSIVKYGVEIFILTHFDNVALHIHILYTNAYLMLKYRQVDLGIKDDCKSNTFAKLWTRSTSFIC